ncbi:hypothetical protein K437DRAFT_265243 [Tilletiaria anomala UBC 951]|uniref:GAR domain-containing protein n=1 Tax=Tilletiaria anomala (strain ATCC 24038 / CBS 436.72 / UBC 951) TaxID=1037660 RepID=A0A066V4N2_TILAU|nr:uncharacterized protein K437DRAFT_265243 [Tilletiaria anomala UBC 951]KDN36692.1 hypothetical protein K437DRAFT_265243 [Tilletiaria anomala UBC 951]
MAAVQDAIPPSSSPSTSLLMAAPGFPETPTAVRSGAAVATDVPNASAIALGLSPSQELAQQISALRLTDADPDTDVGTDAHAAPALVGSGSGGSRRERLRAAARALEAILQHLQASRSAIFQLEEVRHAVSVALPGAATVPAANDTAAGQGTRGENKDNQGHQRERAADQLMIQLDDRLQSASRLFSALELEIASLAQAPPSRVDDVDEESDAGVPALKRSGSESSLASTSSFDDELFFAAAAGADASAPSLASLQARFGAASAEWVAVQDEVELLRRELVEDKQLAVLEGTCMHVESVMDSLERAVNAARELGWKCQEEMQVLHSWRHQQQQAVQKARGVDIDTTEQEEELEDCAERAERMRMLLDELREVRRKLEVKKEYYFPSIDKAFVGLEAMLKNRATSNGHLLRRRHELGNRWKSLRDGVGKFERDLARTERKLRAEAHVVFGSNSGTGAGAAADQSTACLADSPSNSSSLSTNMRSSTKSSAAGAGAASSSPTRPTKSLLRVRPNGHDAIAAHSSTSPSTSASAAVAHTPPRRSISLSSLPGSQGSVISASTPPQKLLKSSQRGHSGGSAAPGHSSGSSSTKSNNRTAAPVPIPAASRISLIGAAPATDIVHGGAAGSRYAHIGPRVSSRRPPPSPSPTMGRSSAITNAASSSSSLQAGPPAQIYSSSWQSRSVLDANAGSQVPKHMQQSMQRAPLRGVSPSISSSPYRLASARRDLSLNVAERSKTPQPAPTYARSRSRAGSEPPEAAVMPGSSAASGWRARVDARLAAQRAGSIAADESMESIGDDSYVSTSTVHHPRSGSSLGFSTGAPLASAARTNQGRGGTARPMSMLGSYYRPPSVTGNAKEEIEEICSRYDASSGSGSTDRATMRQSFIPRLSSNGSIADTFSAGADHRSVSLSAIRRPASAQSNASNDSLQGASRIPLRSPSRHHSTASTISFGASRLSMQTPEPVIAARAQRLSMFAKPSGITNSAQRKASRPPPTRYNVGGVASHGSSASASAGAGSGNSSGTVSLNPRKASGRSTPLSAAALANVPDASRSIDIARSSLVSHDSSVANFRAQKAAAASREGASTPTHSERSFGSRSYASSAFGGGGGTRTGGNYYDGYQPNPFDDLDVEIARIVNELGVALERLDERLPKGQRLDLGPGKEAQARYLVGGKAVMCKILELHRPGHGSGRSSTKARKIMVRAEGFWQDLEGWLLTKLRQ